MGYSIVSRSSWKPVHRIAMCTAALMAMPACTSTPDSPPQTTSCTGGPCVAIGQVQTFADAEITPLEVIEDSRCPINARCVWAGRVRLQAEVLTDAGTHRVVLDSSETTVHRDLKLEIEEIAPLPTTQSSPIPKASYRFRFSVVPVGMESIPPG